MKALVMKTARLQAYLLHVHVLLLEVVLKGLEAVGHKCLEEMSCTVKQQVVTVDTHPIVLRKANSLLAFPCRSHLLPRAPRQALAVSGTVDIGNHQLPLLQCLSPHQGWMAARATYLLTKNNKSRFK